MVGLHTSERQPKENQQSDNGYQTRNCYCITPGWYDSYQTQALGKQQQAPFDCYSNLGRGSFPLVALSATEWSSFKRNSIPIGDPA